jgi:hypothetical protein
MKKISLFLGAILLMGLFFSSCVKDAKTANPGFNVSEAGTNALNCLQVPLDIYLQVDRAIRSQHDSIVKFNLNQPSYTYAIGYINYTVLPADTVTYPKTITVNFGSTTTNIYTGTITIQMSGNMNIAGSKCGLTYTNLATGGTSTATGATIKGTDSIFATGTNASGSYSYRFKLQSDETLGYNNEKVSYSGNIYPLFNKTSKAYAMDSVLINATDAGLNSLKLYSIENYKLAKLSTCSYFSTGAINTDVTVGGVLVGTVGFDFSYSSTGVTGDCDSYGAAYVTGQNSYQNSFAFVAKLFQ